MVTSRHRLFSAALATALAATALTLVPAAGAQAADTTYKACANKKTGAMRLVVKGKKCKKGEKKLTWNTQGPQGTTGPTGPQGATGPQGIRGLPGAYKAVDQAGRDVGTLFGLYSGVLPLVRLSSGALLVWDNVAANPNAIVLIPPTLFYRQAGCVGDAYYPYPGGQPFDMGIIMSATGAPGSPVFKPVPGTPQAFTAASVQNPGGCTAAAAAVSNAFVAKPAGTVPVVAQPMTFEPVG